MRQRWMCGGRRGTLRVAAWIVAWIVAIWALALASASSAPAGELTGLQLLPSQTRVGMVKVKLLVSDASEAPQRKQTMSWLMPKV